MRIQVVAVLLRTELLVENWPLSLRGDREEAAFKVCSATFRAEFPAKKTSMLILFFKLLANVWQTLRGLFSVVPKPTFVSKWQMLV